MQTMRTARCVPADRFPDGVPGTGRESSVSPMTNASSAARESCNASAAEARNLRTGLVPHVSGVSLGVFSRASFAIQPRPRLRTLLDGAGPQAHGVAGMRKTT
eukprot:scaffold39055_cov59-Phaeocystis_antarctica.AAC.1